MDAIGALWKDLRYAVRSFSKDRGSVALVLLALSLAIGATTVMFSVVYNVLIDPFPYKDASQLVYVYIHDMKNSGPYGRSARTVKEFFDLKAQNHVFSNLIAADGMNVVYRIGNTSYQAIGGMLDPATFTDLGVKPELGREVAQSDGAPGAPPVFVISDRLWHERFNRDPKVLGQTFTVNNTQRTLVAIMPPRFLLFRGDVFVPMNVTPDLNATAVGGPASQPLYVWTAGRLRPGVTLAQAAADCEVVARNEAKLYPDLYPKQFKVNVGTIIDQTTAGLRTMIYVLVGAVLMLLLIACANVANLLLARATAREKELAIRATMGASRGRLVRQLLAESFVLASVGAAIGCFLAYGGLQYVKAMIPPNTVPEEIEISLNWPALVATIGVTVLTTLLCGLVPALRAAAGDLHERLMSTGKGVGGSSAHGKLRGVLVGAQVGLSIILLVGAGLMMRTFFALTHVDLGFDAKNLLVGRIVFPQGTYGVAAQKQAFFRQVLPRIASLPGVTAATESIAFPGDGGASSAVTVPGSTHSDTWNSDIELVSEGYFQAVGLSLVRGNLLSQQDIDGARQMAVINRKLAHDFFGDTDPIGRTIKFNVLDGVPDAPHNAFFQIVGIVSDARNDGLEKPPAPEAFLPYSITGIANRAILVRTSVDPNSVLQNVRGQIASVDNTVALSQARSLEETLQRDFMAAPEFGLVLLAVFAGIGLILSAIGVFSVMAYTVSLQTRDIGIRMALGAQPQGVLKMVLLSGMRPVFAGLVLGLLASYALTRLMASQIYGVTATDPWTFAGVVIVLGIVGVTACFLPARRATQVNPLIALRYE